MNKFKPDMGRHCYFQDPRYPVAICYDYKTTGQIIDLIINAYKELPPRIQNQTQLVIDPRLRNIKLSIPLEGL